MKSRFEEMGSFFDQRVDGYEEHMRGMFNDFELFYETVAVPIAETDERINILDLGCGTGAELNWIFKRVPNATVTAIDLSEQMLSKLVQKFDRYKGQIHPIHGSYLTLPFEEKQYDYVVSVYTMHHFTADVKLELYKKILGALKTGGKYIEGDCVVTPEKEKEIWEWYAQRYSEEHIKEACDARNTLYHIDIPCTVETQLRLLREAGFSKVDLIWHEEGEEPAIFVAEV
jgi:tRNA (cmo5U34)-methyltransferase